MNFIGYIFEKIPFVFLFYLALICLVIYFKRKSKSKGVVLVKQTKWGTNFIYNAGRKLHFIFNPLFNFGVIISYFVAILSVITLILVSTQIFKPKVQVERELKIAILIPGVTTIEEGGQKYTIPLLEGILAIIILVIAHEFAHGFAAASSGLKPEKLGVFLFIFLPGAFVKVNENKVYKKKLLPRLRFYAAGSIGNFIICICFVGLLLGLQYIKPKFVERYDFHLYVTKLMEGKPAAKILKEGDEIIRYNNVTINLTTYYQVFYYKYRNFPNNVFNLKPNQTIYITVKRDGKIYTFNITTVGTNDTSRGIIGYYQIATFKERLKYFKRSLIYPYINFLVIAIFSFFAEICLWSLTLNLGVGVINLLPILPLDGGRIFADIMYALFSPRLANFFIRVIMSFILLTFLLILVYPHAQALISGIFGIMSILIDFFYPF